MRISRLQEFAALVLGLCVMDACGSGDAPPKRSGPITADVFWEAGIRAACEGGAQCGTTDVEKCVDDIMRIYRTFREAGVPDPTVTAVQEGRATFDANAAQRCVDAIKAGACQQHSFSTLDSMYPDCAAVYTGTIPGGAACVVSQECQLGYFCAPPDQMAVCIGAVCQRDEIRCNEDRECANGYRCDFRWRGRTVAGPTPRTRGGCVPSLSPGGLMEPCGVNGECQPGLYCSTRDSETIEETPMESCLPLRAAGAPCDDSYSACLDGLRCIASSDQQSNTCMRMVGKGEPCVASQCQGYDLICDDRTHRCVDAQTSGPCDPKRWDSCNIDLAWCHATTCEKYVLLGGDCSGEKRCIAPLRCQPGPTAGAMTCQGFAGCDE